MKAIQQLTRQKALYGLPVARILPYQTTAAGRLWQRNFSATASAAQLAGLDASKLTVSKTQTPKELIPNKDLVFGKTFTGMRLYSVCRIPGNG